MVNRRMFRPGFPDVKEPSTPRPQHNGPIPNKSLHRQKRPHAENFYWVKQMQSHTAWLSFSMTVKVLRGTVEWYDRDCIKPPARAAPTAHLQARDQVRPQGWRRIGSGLATSKPSNLSTCKGMPGSRSEGEQRLCGQRPILVNISHSVTTKFLPRATRVHPLDASDRHRLQVVDA